MIVGEKEPFCIVFIYSGVSVGGMLKNTDLLTLTDVPLVWSCSLTSTLIMCYMYLKFAAESFGVDCFLTQTEPTSISTSHPPHPLRQDCVDSLRLRNAECVSVKSLHIPVISWKAWITITGLFAVNCSTVDAEANTVKKHYI